MNNTNKWKIYTKLIKVIESCKTRGQISNIKMWLDKVSNKIKDKELKRDIMRKYYNKKRYLLFN